MKGNCPVSWPNLSYKFNLGWGTIIVERYSVDQESRCSAGSERNWVSHPRGAADPVLSTCFRPKIGHWWRQSDREREERDAWSKLTWGNRAKGDGYGCDRSGKKSPCWKMCPTFSIPRVTGTIFPLPAWTIPFKVQLHLIQSVRGSYVGAAFCPPIPLLDILFRCSILLLLVLPWAGNWSGVVHVASQSEMWLNWALHCSVEYIYYLCETLSEQGLAA